MEQKKTINNNNAPSFKSFALLLSEVSYLIIILIMVSFGLIFPSYHKSVTYYSKSNIEEWNTSSDPFIFTHISDIHITFLNDIEKYRPLFRAAKKLNASFHLLTGDLGDNYLKSIFQKLENKIIKIGLYIKIY